MGASSKEAYFLAVLRQVVESSSLKSVGHDAARSLLEIEFRNGRVYRYEGVPRAVYRELLRAASVGIYFNTHVRDRFPTTLSSA